MPGRKSILRSVRWPLFVFLLFAVTAVGLLVWIEISSKPPMTLPISLKAGVTRSAPFSVSEGGLKTIGLKVAFTGDEKAIACALARARTVEACPREQVELDWVILRNGRPYASRMSVMEGYDGGGVSYHGDFGYASQEIGTPTLEAGDGYVLEVESLTDASGSGLVDPRVQVAMHPWEVKEGLGLLVIFAGLALLATFALIWLLIALAIAMLARRATATQRG